MPPVTLRMMKEFVVRFGDLPTDQAGHLQNLINNLLIQGTTDGEEGRQAFNKKRPPNFTAAAMPGKSPRKRTPTALTMPIAAASFEDRSRTEGSPSEIPPALPRRSWQPILASIAPEQKP